MYKYITTLLVRLLFRLKKIQFGNDFYCIGIPYIRSYGTLTFGNFVTMNSGLKANAVFGLACNTIICKEFANINIGNNVGMSNVSIYCKNSIHIGDNTLLGAGVKIWDTDFHSLNPDKRLMTNDVGSSLPINIGSNCFIGAGSIILKGVTIGNNVVVGAGSVLAKNVPDNEIWAGNPCCFIKKIEDTL